MIVTYKALIEGKANTIPFPTSRNGSIQNRLRLNNGASVIRLVSPLEYFFLLKFRLFPRK